MMARLLCLLSITALGGVNAAETSYFRIAEAFTPRHGEELEVSYRVFTAPILSEIPAGGSSLPLSLYFRSQFMWLVALCLAGLG